MIYRLAERAWLVAVSVCACIERGMMAKTPARRSTSLMRTSCCRTALKTPATASALNLQAAQELNEIGSLARIPDVERVGRAGAAARVHEGVEAAHRNVVQKD